MLGRRRARVVREEMREGSDLFSIHAYLPAQASFGFANDMRRQSSGTHHDGHMHMVFSEQTIAFQVYFIDNHWLHAVQDTCHDS